MAATLVTALRQYIDIRKIKMVELPLYKPGRTLGIQEVDAPNWHMKVVELSALRIDHFYPQGRSLVLVSVRASVDTWAIVRPEGLSQ